MLIKVLISVLIPGSKSNKEFAPAVAPVANVSTPVGRDAILQCFVSIPKSINNIDAIRVSFSIWYSFNFNSCFLDRMDQSQNERYFNYG